MPDTERVPMHHPELLPDRTIMVRPAGVAARKARGWALGEGKAPPKELTPPARRRPVDIASS